MTPEELSRALRHGTDELLSKRRAILRLALVAAGSMMPISLYQMGVIKHLPEPPLPRLDADRVDASSEAYAILWTPDAVLGLGSYALTAWLAAVGGPDRARTHPWIPIALAAKVGGDALFGAKLTVDQWTKHRAFCSWCLLAAGASVAAVPFAIPEARAALAGLRGKRL